MVTEIHKPLCLSLFVALLLVSTHSVCDGQETEIAKLLPRDTPALLEISDVATTFERLANLPLFSDPRWLEVQRLLEDGEKPLIPTERLIKTLQTFDKIETLLAEIDTVALAVHDMDQDIGTVFIQGNQETLNELQSYLMTIVGCISARTPIKELETLGLEASNEAIEKTGSGLRIHRFPELLVVSNSPQYMELLNVFQGVSTVKDAVEKENADSGAVETETSDETPTKQDGLAASIDDGEDAKIASMYSPENFKSLLDSRAYLTIKKRSTRLKEKAGLISIFVRPSTLSRFFPNFDKSSWKGYGFHELTGAGLNFVIMPTPTSSEQPMLLADATVMFTEPKTGKALMMSHYEPVEIPYLTVKPISLMTFARDEELYYEESLRCFDQMHGQDAGKNYFLGRFKGSDRDFYDDALPRRLEYLSLEYRSKENIVVKEAPAQEAKAQETQLGWVDVAGTGKTPHPHSNHQAMSFERIKNADCMLRYVKGMVKGQVFKRFDDPDFHLWRRPDDQAKNNIGRLIDKSSSPHHDNLTHDSYLVGSQWYVEGEWPQARIQLEHLDQLKTDQTDYGVPLRSLIKNLLYQTKDENPIQINYYEPDSWNKTIAGMRENRFTAVNRINLEPTGKPGEFRIVVTGARASTLPFLPTPSEPDEEKVPNQKSGTIKLNNMNFQITGLNDLELMIADPKESNQFKAKRKIARMLADSFGRELVLFTKSDSELRAIFGCYPMPVESQENE